MLKAGFAQSLLLYLSNGLINREPYMEKIFAQTLYYYFTFAE